MKILAAGDIHGSAKRCLKLIEAFKAEKADILLLLGDLLKHKSLPIAGDITVPSLLNPLSKQIVCVRGNNDWTCDQDFFEFNSLQEHQQISFGQKKIFASHGHHYHPQNLPPIDFDIFIQGHTHVPGYRRYPDYLYLNPGAISRPMAGSTHGYLILEEHKYSWKNLDQQVLFIYEE